MFSIVEDELSDTSRYDNKRRKLAERYEKICPKGDFVKFEDVKNDLSEAFIKKDTTIYWKSELTWVHPSCQDLVIQEFASDSALRKQYIQNCSIEGIKLATSSGGGEKGKRTLPLLVDDNDWDLCLDRTKTLLREIPQTIQVIQGNFDAFLKLDDQAIPENSRVRFDKYVFGLLEEINHNYHRYSQMMAIEVFESYYIIREKISRYVPTIDPVPFWKTIVSQIDQYSKDPTDLYSDEAISILPRFLAVINKHDPSWLSNPFYKAELDQILKNDISKLIEDNINSFDISDWEIDDLEDVGLKFYNELSTYLEDIYQIELLEDYADPLEYRVEEINSLRYEIESYIEENKTSHEEEYDYRSSYRSDRANTADITSIFSDL